MKYIVYYDSGTSNSRIFLVDESGTVRHAAKKHVGSRDSAIAGGNKVLVDGLWELYSDMLSAAGLRDADIGAIYASGMITSPFGLLEVPHMTLPATLREFADSFVDFHEPTRFKRTITLIPGAKTVHPDFTLVNNVRGEEIEAVGVLDELALRVGDASAAVVFPGSHTHAILIRDETLCGLLSHFSGELFEALRKETILAPILNAEMDGYDSDMVRMAVRNLRDHGFNRALYIGHAMQIFREKTPAQRRSYIEGVLAGGVGLSLARAFRNEWSDCATVALVGGRRMCDLYETIFSESGCTPKLLRLTADQDAGYGLRGTLRLLRMRDKA